MKQSFISIAALWAAAASEPQQFRAKKLRSLIHEGAPFTQGLELVDDDTLIETSGAYPPGTASFIRFIDLHAGTAKQKGTSGLEKRFAEGIAKVKEGWLVTTWSDHKALRYGPNLDLVAEEDYPWQGWGFAHDTKRDKFLATDGSPFMMQLNAETLKLEKKKAVTCMGHEVPGMNELEYVEDFADQGSVLFGNIYMTRFVLGVDPETFKCKCFFDLEGFGAQPESEQMGFHVANGIAYLPKSKSFIVTGKNWDEMFEISLEAKTDGSTDKLRKWLKARPSGEVLLQTPRSEGLTRMRSMRSMRSQRADSGQLQPGKLIKMYQENHEEIGATINADMGGTKMRAMGEIAPVTSADDCLTNIDEWSRDRWVGGLFDRQYVRPEPKGVVLIIAPWNVPWQLTMRPLTAAIAAGNAVVLKPSELNPRTAPLMEKLVHKYMDPECFRVVQGAVEETTALLNNRWDHIFYTGNGQVGRIVMAAAAKHLTTVTLELGGKSPVIVDETAKIDVAVKRIALMKWSLSGQICVAPDYVFVHQSVEKDFLDQLKAVVISSTGEDGKGRVDDFGMIVNEKHVDRLENLIQTSGGSILCGGAEGIEREERFVPPTIIHKPKMDAPIMQEEIFGPILPVMPYEDLETALKIIRFKDTPLAFYVFSQDSGNIEKALSHVQSGGVCINTVFEHLLPETLPFGGQGASGMGAYHGKFGFDEFSHRRAILVKSTLPGMRGTLFPLPQAGKAMPQWIYPVVMKLQFGIVPQSMKACWRGVYATLMAPIRRLFFA